MKLSRKYKKHLKKNIATLFTTTALVTCTLAVLKLTGISVPLNRFNGQEKGIETQVENVNNLQTAENNEMMTTSNEGIAVQSEEVATANILENTDTITYIYTAQDLVDFRDSVNAGDDYAGKTVYLMDNIDLSTVCSSTLGSWVPIGGGINPIVFAGTFDGNYHTISNLYINSNNLKEGFFVETAQNAIIQNLRMSNININNTFNNNVSGDTRIYTGSIVCHNYGTISNCGIESGNIIGKNTVANWYTPMVGGIVSSNYGTISGCYNRALVKTDNNVKEKSNNDRARAGGIAGENYKNIENCYNTGKIDSLTLSYDAQIAGIVSLAGLRTGETGYIKNCYNNGMVEGHYKYYTTSGVGIAGQNGWSETYYAMPITNCYYNYDLGKNYAYYYWNGNGTSRTTVGNLTTANLKTYTVTLGSAFAYDVYNKNNGNPVLTWENITPVMSLDKNQAYIKVDEKLQLNVVQSEEIDELIGYNYNASNFKWTSTNEDVATVDENGLVTGLTEGYTTIYAYNEEADLYAMAVINVAKYFTNPQIGTGNGFTTVLKSNGTVWAIGNNTNGQLGDGTNINAKKLVKVHIDENTELNNIVKIAVGSDHVLALTKDGNVYAWGSNTQGQLGQNNNENSNYAKLVLNEEGTGNLSNIVDISAGTNNSVALDKDGNVYVWGIGTNGTLGNYATDSSNLPVKNTTIEKAMQVSVGNSTVSALTSDGIVWSWGYNTSGQLGINSTGNTSYPMKTTLNVTDTSRGNYHSIVKKIDGTVYGAGTNGVGHLGTGESGTNSTIYKQVNLPNTVTETNKIKYVKAGRGNSTLLLSDGTVWSTGQNTNGELGNGGTTNSSAFVQGLTASNTALENILIIGENKGKDVTGAINTGDASLNTAVITKDGNIYTTGDNTYGQIKSSEIEIGTPKTLYYKKMENLDIKLTYTEKNIGILPSGTYQIDKNKLQYIYNAYADIFEIKNLRYSSLNEEVVTVDQNGIITAKNIQRGTAKVKVEDLDNGYETYIILSINRKSNTENTIYIYDIEELVDFRDTVNAGDDYAGKTVHLMEDIDMSTACSETLGSFTPIGAAGTRFAGTFNGNYHTISNLYINSNKYRYVGFFAVLTPTAVIQNLKLSNININNTNNQSTLYTYTGGISSVLQSDGQSQGKILNCGIESGSIIGVNSANSSSRGTTVGGIIGYNKGTILGCYNKASVSSIQPSNYKGRAYAGGIVGQNYSYIENCYNTGDVKCTESRTYAGGIAGEAYLWSGQTGHIKNCYNIGNVEWHFYSGGTGRGGGIVGMNGWNSSSSYKMPITNCYCITGQYYSNSWNCDYHSASGEKEYVSPIKPDTMKTYTPTMGYEYAYDIYNINNEYPVLVWENITPVMSLDKNQAYIKIGETLNLNVVKEEIIEQEIGISYANTDFTWTSTNEDVATVDENGLVTGLTEGYTTIYAYNEEADLYAMAVVNVAKYFANPQIGTGNGFTAILKADGTVWTIGNNASGQLGNGTNINTSGTVKVHINDDTALSNIVKISVGSDHVLALTKDGNVYAWGSNTQGELGQNDNENLNYAKLVLNEDGTGNLSNIVDISAAGNDSIALDKDGNTYVWGNGSYGEIGNKAIESSKLPVKNEVDKGIKVSIGCGSVGVLRSDGILWAWGRNNNGALGINTTANTSYGMKTSLNVTDFSHSGPFSAVKKTDGEVYTVGYNGLGALGTGDTTNHTTYVKATLPSSVTEGNAKVKYIEAGLSNTILLLSDGTVWETGHNVNGQLGNGTTTTSTSFVQGLTASETPLQNVLTIGRSAGNLSGSDTAGWGLNTAVIRKDGNIYTAGSNAYGQVGTTKVRKQTSYYTIMGDEPYLIYKESPVEMSSNEQYTINRNKLEYVYRSINVYEELKYQINNLKFTSLNEDIATVDQNGVITAKEVRTGVTKIKVEDVDNGYDTYITIIVNRLPNTDTMTYIYTAQDLADFRDLVNAGDDYEGKTAYVMEDIDMSTKCSEATGSWVPIGEIYSEPDSETGIVTKKYFAGTFDGNNHTISNLYIDSSEYISTGLFSRTTNTAVIKNIIMSNVNVNNTYSVATTSIYTGSIVGINRRNNFELWYKKWKHCRNKNSSKHCKWFIPCCKSRRNIRR